MPVRPRRAAVITLLCLVSALPFIPSGWIFLQEGVPEGLFPGDAAALELRVLHAEQSVQLVGPHSQWGWSHPGPAYFYLALPIYELLGRRGAALNVFAFLVNFVALVAIVLAARRLRGSLFAMAVAALLAVHGLAGIPGLLTNESNQLLPILPLALAAILAGRMATGTTGLWPALILTASAIVQTDVAFALPVAALLAVALVAGRRFAVSRRTLIASAIVAAACWTLPLYDAFAGSGNLQQVARLFASGTPSGSWGDAMRVTAEQLAVLPLALLRTLRLDVDATRTVTMTLAAAQALAVASLVVLGWRRGDRVLTQLAGLALVQMAVAIVAVGAIPGEAASHPVAWISVASVLAWTAIAAWVMPSFERALLPRNARALTAFATVGLIALANSAAGRPRVYGERDVTVDALAATVEDRLRGVGIGGATASPASAVPIAHIESQDTWPAAIGVVVHLYKSGVPIAVADEWLRIAGHQLAAPPGVHPRLWFGDATLRDRAAGSNLMDLGDLGWVYVYFEPVR